MNTYEKWQELEEDRIFWLQKNERKKMQEKRKKEEQLKKQQNEN